MTFKTNEDAKAQAYNLASHVISSWGNNSELTIRTAMKDGYVLIIDTWRFMVLWSFLVGGAPVFLIVGTICIWFKMSYLETLGYALLFGFVPFVLVLNSCLRENRNNRYWMGLVNNLVTALRQLDERERERVFLFLRHQGVINQKLQQAYDKGYDDGFWDGEMLSD